MSYIIHAYVYLTYVMLGLDRRHKSDIRDSTIQNLHWKLGQ